MAVVTSLLLVLVLPALAGAQPSLPASAAAASCQPTPVRDSLTVVGPMVGSRPAWLVGWDQTYGLANPVKTLWVVAQSSQRVEITGRLLNGSDVAQFRRGTGPITSNLVVEDLARESVIPGGATADVLRDYAFIPSHVFYPTPGCWEFTVAIGDEKHRIIRRIGTGTQANSPMPSVDTYRLDGAKARGPKPGAR